MDVELRALRRVFFCRLRMDFCVDGIGQFLSKRFKIGMLEFDELTRCLVW